LSGGDPRPQRFGLREYAGYAAGEVGNNLTFQMVAAFVLVYYTDVAAIPAAAAGTLLLVARLWGGFTDLLAGHLVDRTSTRWGKFRPYLLLGSVPLLGLLVAVFSIPEGLDAGGTVAWAFVSYALFSLAYSFVNIPYGSLAAAMTQEPDARAKLSTSRVVAASLTILLIAVAVSPQIERSTDLQGSLTVTTIIFAVIGIVLYVVCFATTREAVRHRAATTSVRQTVAMLRHNRPLVLLSASSVLFLAGMFALITVAVYYARDVLGNAELYIVMTVVQTAALVGAATIVPAAVARFGKKRAYVVAGVVAVAAAIGFALAPGSAPVIAIACYGVLGLGLGAINTLIFALQADTVDFGEWKSGVRAEGASYSVLSFMRKAGQAVGGGAAAYTIGLGGYVSGAAVQGDAAVTAIRIAAGIVPAVAIAGAVAVMLAYPLTEESFRKIVGELAGRSTVSNARPEESH
jgi:glucuronide carrier protein